MSENLKKGLLIAVIIVAVLIGGWQVSKTISSETPHVEAEAKVPPGYKSEKERALEAQAQAAGKGQPQPGKSPADEQAQADKEAALAGG